MLELGKAGSAGTERGVLPVLRDGTVVASLRASGWKEAATAVVGDQPWVFAKTRSELTARWAAEPADAVRLRARQTSFWKGVWELDLDGARFERVNTSIWSGRHVYVTGGVQVAGSGSTGGWSPRSVLYAEDSVPLHQQVFLLWLESVLQRRSGDGAVLGGDGGGDGGGGGD